MFPKLWLVILLTTLFLSGCWDLEDVSKQAIVLAVGLDQTVTGRVKVSLQIPIVEKSPAVPGGEPMSAKPFSLIMAEGKSLLAAIPGLQSKTQRRLLLDQVKAVVISTALAQQGLKGTIDFLHRHPTLPPQALLLLTDRKASQVLNFTLGNKRIPTSELVAFFQGPSKRDRVFSQHLWEFHRNINSRTQDAFIPLLNYNLQEKTFAIVGLGVFRRDRLVGKLSANEARMFGMLAGKTKDGYLSIPTQQYGRLGFRRISAHPQFKLRRNKAQWEFEIKVKVKGHLAESTRGATGFTIRDWQRIEAVTANYLKREMLKTLRRLQLLNSDLLALGEKLRATAPREWAALNWEQAYPKAQLRLEVKFRIYQIGIML